MYAFFRIAGHDDSLALAKRLVTEAGLGLAPGAAFGDEGEGWLRWCFASHDPARLTVGVERLKRFPVYNLQVRLETAGQGTPLVGFTGVRK